MAADQPGNATAVHAWGAGIAIPADAGAEAMASATRQILTQPSYTERTREIAQQFASVDGAAKAADEIEELFVKTQSHGS